MYVNTNLCWKKLLPLTIEHNQHLITNSTEGDYSRCSREQNFNIFIEKYLIYANNLAWV